MAAEDVGRPKGVDAQLHRQRGQGLDAMALRLDTSLVAVVEVKASAGKMGLKKNYEKMI